MRVASPGLDVQQNPEGSPEAGSVGLRRLAALVGTESPCSRRRHTSSSGVSHCGRGPSDASFHLVRQGFTLAVHLEEQDLQLL